ncbi:MAG: hypothetical protein E6J34_09235 [Chloroflexi bacterium]|nr:MAG: hypothetical protein E6J34_09235 [Chloroflexota bacterium]
MVTIAYNQYCLRLRCVRDTQMVANGRAMCIDLSLTGDVMLGITVPDSGQFQGISVPISGSSPPPDR